MVRILTMEDNRIAGHNSFLMSWYVFFVSNNALLFVSYWILYTVCMGLRRVFKQLAYLRIWSQLLNVASLFFCKSLRVKEKRL